MDYLWIGVDTKNKQDTISLTFEQQQLIILYDLMEIKDKQEIIDKISMKLTGHKAIKDSSSTLLTIKN